MRTTGSQPAGSLPKEETSDKANNNVSKNTWIKLKGPAAESLSKAFFGPAVVVLQENKGVRRAAEAAEEDTAIVPTAPVRQAEGGGAVTTGRGGTTVSVSPARIVIAGTAGAGKSIKVLKTYRIVLLGRTGAGKSSLANTIFGEDVFKIKHSSTCGTRECQAESKSVYGRRITLVDTPDFLHTDRPEEELKREIVRSITECAPGPHAFFIVLKVGPFTKHDEAVVTKMFNYFSEEALKYVAVVFTHGDQLPEGVKIEEFVNQNKCLSDLVKKCSGRCHVVDNKYWKNNQRDEYRSNWFQVAELLNTTDKILMENKGGCYTNEMLNTVSRVIQEKSNRTAFGNMPQGHSSSTADNNVSKNVWIKLIGPAAESLVTAFLCTPVIDLRGTGRENGEVKEEVEEATEIEEEAKETEDKAEEAENEEVATEPEAATDKDAEEVREGKTAQQGQQAGGGGFLGSLCGSFFGIVAAVVCVTTAVVGGAVTALGAAVAAMVGAIGVGIGATATALGIITWVKLKLEGILKDLQQHRGIILLVAVFYLMLLLSFWEQVRMFGVILLCLLLVLLLLLS